MRFLSGVSSGDLLEFYYELSVARRKSQRQHAEASLVILSRLP